MSLEHLLDRDQGISVHCRNINILLTESIGNVLGKIAIS